VEAIGLLAGDAEDVPSLVFAVLYLPKLLSNSFIIIRVTNVLTHQIIKNYYRVEVSLTSAMVGIGKLQIHHLLAKKSVPGTTEMETR
jgi:hypothetical protein